MMKRLIYIIVFILPLCLTFQTASANELLIWDQLQGKAPKGYVLLFRHSLAPGVGDPANFKLNDCSTQRNLSAEGREDAKEIGQWLQRRASKDLHELNQADGAGQRRLLNYLIWARLVLNPNLDSLFQEADSTKHPQTSKGTPANN
jgi:hypothetical protein